MSGKPEGLKLIKKSLSTTEATIEFEVPHVFVVLGASVIILYFLFYSIINIKKTKAKKHSTRKNETK